MIYIYIYRRETSSDDLIYRIRVHGHAKGRVGVRACYGVSILSRTLLHAVGIKDLHSEELEYGSFDIDISNKHNSQQAARYTITGYRMIAKYAPLHVRIQTVRLVE